MRIDAAPSVAWIDFGEPLHDPAAGAFAHAWSDSLSEWEIARLAGARSGMAALVREEVSLREKRGSGHRERESKVLQSLAAVAANRQRQTASSTARKLHFGIASSLAAAALAEESLSFLKDQVAVQERLIQDGIGIEDPWMLERTRLKVESERLTAQSRVSELRIQLSAWIGSEHACGHAPGLPPVVVPSDIDVCEYVEQALACRCELVHLRWWAHHLESRDLDGWDAVAGETLSLPASPRRSFGAILPKIFQPSFHDGDAVEARKRWITRLLAERSSQVTVEVETAYQKKRTSALLWANAQASVDSWAMRIEQLQRLGEARGNVPEQISARLAWLEARGQMIQRWWEWNEARIDLEHAVGCHDGG